MNENQNMNNSNEFTNDYNQLYGGGQPTPTVGTNQSQIEEPTIVETPIIFENENQPVREVVEDVIPTFDTSVLEELPDDLKPATPAEPLINTIAKESQQEKEQNKRNMIFIAILFAVLIFAVLVIFPLLLNI